MPPRNFVGNAIWITSYQTLNAFIFIDDFSFEFGASTSFFLASVSLIWHYLDQFVVALGLGGDNIY